MALQLLRSRGALNEAAAGDEPVTADGLATRPVPPEVVELIPESVARENLVMPLTYDGETITCATVDASNIALADKVRFIVAKNVRLVPAPRQDIVAAINRHYGHTETESVDSMLSEFTDTAIAWSRTHPVPPPAAAPVPRGRGGMGTYLGRSIAQVTAGGHRPDDEDTDTYRYASGPHQGPGRRGMLFYTVDEGQRVLMRRRNGTMQIVEGPQRVWAWGRSFKPMQHFVAHPDKFLTVRFRDGRQEHIPGPAEIWLDPLHHLGIGSEDALQIAAKEAVVVYSRGDNVVKRRVVLGPALFVPQPGEWLHTFSWHASKGGSAGVHKVANALVFQKLWLMPDQMYHDVHDVRTADDAVLSVRLMIFFELTDIERMLDATHDPIGDFVNAATSDVVEFTGRHNFEQFKRNTEKLNEMDTYRQLLGRAAQCGYRINKVVYRGYGTAPALQQMHDHAIEARTKLQLDRATEEQTQDLEDYKLAAQLARAGKRRTEQTGEVEHDIELARKRQEAELRQREAQHTAAREARRLEAEMQLEARRRQDAQQREHLAALRELGVDLTAFLTQARADRVIELRGATPATHVHLDRIEGNGATPA
jgi:hypothetical protein